MKNNIRRFFSLILAIVMVTSISSVAFAAEPSDDLLIQTETVIEEMGGTALTSEDNVTRSGDLTQYYDITMNASSSSYSGTFNVTNASETVYVVWGTRSNNTPETTGAVFQCTILDSKGSLKSRTLLYGDGTTKGYPIGRLATGRYTFRINPYSGLSGNYRCVFVFVPA